MKKLTPIIIAMLAITIAASSLQTSVQAAYTTYFGFNPGDKLTYVYTATPGDTTHQSPLSVELPFEILAVTDISDTCCNVTWKVTFKVLVEEIPTEMINTTTRTLWTGMNVTEYVFNATNPWQLFFAIKSSSGITVNVPADKNWPIGSGTIKWRTSGALETASFSTSIDGEPYTVTITEKTGSNAIPGYSTALIIVVAAIPTALLAYRIAKKGRRALAE